MRLCLDPTIEVGPSNGELITELPAAREPEVSTTGSSSNDRTNQAALPGRLRP